MDMLGSSLLSYIDREVVLSLEVKNVLLDEFCGP